MQKRADCLPVWVCAFSDPCHPFLGVRKRFKQLCHGRTLQEQHQICNRPTGVVIVLYCRDQLAISHLDHGLDKPEVS